MARRQSRRMSGQNADQEGRPPSLIVVSENVEHTIARDQSISPGAMSSKCAISPTAARYLSQSGQYPSKRNKTDKKGKKSQASTSGGGACNLTLPRTRSSTQPGSSISDVDPLPEGLSAQPSEQGEASPVPRIRTNLVRLGMDVLPGKSFLEGTIDAPELVRSLVTPRDAEILEEQGLAALRERYCKMAMESVLIGDSLHSQYEAMLRDSLSQRKKLAEDQLRLDTELKKLREENITLKTDHSKLEQKLKDERKGHQETRATVTKLEKAREMYKQSSEFKDDVRESMSTSEAVEEFSASAAGWAALEAQTQLAFDLGMFTMQQQIYPVLKGENPNFDPEAVGLPKFMENPDPESEEYDISPVDADDAGVSDRPDNTNTAAQDAAEDPTTATKDA